MKATLSVQQLLQRLKPSDWVITPNNRLATYLHTEYAEQAKTRIFETPTILPYQACLTKLWQAASLITGRPERLLTPLQLTWLWTTLLREASEINLLHLEGCTDLMISAEALCLEYGVSLDDPRLSETPDSGFFVHYARQCRAYCKTHQLISPAQVATVLTELPIADILPDHIYLVGFLEMTPAQQQLWQHCQNLGVTLEEIQFTVPHHDTHYLQFPSLSQELETMAQTLIQKAHAFPEARIACVIHNLPDLRSRVSQLFENTEIEVNIAGGEYLFDLPLIYHALHLLLLKQTLDISECSLLMLTPWLPGSVEEKSARAQQLYRWQETTFPTSPDTLLAALDTCPQLHIRLSKFWQYALPNTARFSEWAHHFAVLLQHLGWPGDQITDSKTYQCLTKFHECLDQLASLEQVAPPVSFRIAWQQLKDICQKTLFQTQSLKPRIYILGLLEALSMPFDFLWVMSLDHTTWPLPPNPHPYLPMTLQKQLAFPKSSHHKEIGFATEVSALWKQTSTELVLSFSEHYDHEHRRPSPLFTALPTQKQASKALVSPALTLAAIPVFPVPVDTQEQSQLRGGTKILKLQALCPFRAFAEIRLHATPWPTQKEGLSPLDRGQLLHKTLELIWQELKTHEHLCQQTHLSEFIFQKITLAWHTLILPHISKAQQQLETERAALIIEKFLALEKTRLPFTVLAIEKRETITLAGLTLRVQMDRIDQLSHNSLSILIDYKTGDVSLSDWFDARLSEVQLPLYASLGTPPHAITFAQLQLNEVRYKGIYEGNTSPLPQLTPLEKVNREHAQKNLTDQQQQWQQQLTELAQDFLKGNVAVHPKNGEQTCRTCHLSQVCRIRQTQMPPTTGL